MLSAPFWTPSETKISVLLSASVERFGVSRTRENRDPCHTVTQSYSHTVTQSHSHTVTQLLSDISDISDLTLLQEPVTGLKEVDKLVYGHGAKRDAG